MPPAANPNQQRGAPQQRLNVQQQLAVIQTPEVLAEVNKLSNEIQSSIAAVIPSVVKRLEDSFQSHAANKTKQKAAKSAVYEIFGPFIMRNSNDIRPDFKARLGQVAAMGDQGVEARADILRADLAIHQAEADGHDVDDILDASLGTAQGKGDLLKARREQTTVKANITRADSFLEFMNKGEFGADKLVALRRATMPYKSVVASFNVNPSNLATFFGSIKNENLDTQHESIKGYITSLEQKQARDIKKQQGVDPATTAEITAARSFNKKIEALLTASRNFYKVVEGIVNRFQTIQNFVDARLWTANPVRINGRTIKSVVRDFGKLDANSPNINDLENLYNDLDAFLTAPRQLDKLIENVDSIRLDLDRKADQLKGTLELGLKGYKLSDQEILDRVLNAIVRAENPKSSEYEIGVAQDQKLARLISAHAGDPSAKVLAQSDDSKKLLADKSLRQFCRSKFVWDGGELDMGGVTPDNLEKLTDKRKLFAGLAALEENEGVNGERYGAVRAKLVSVILDEWGVAKQSNNLAVQDAAAAYIDEQLQKMEGGIISDFGKYERDVVDVADKNFEKELRKRLMRALYKRNNGLNQAKSSTKKKLIKREALKEYKDIMKEAAERGLRDQIDPGDKWAAKFKEGAFSMGLKSLGSTIVHATGKKMAALGEYGLRLGGRFMGEKALYLVKRLARLGVGIPGTVLGLGVDALRIPLYYAKGGKSIKDFKSATRGAVRFAKKGTFKDIGKGSKRLWGTMRRFMPVWKRYKPEWRNFETRHAKKDLGAIDDSIKFLEEEGKISDMELTEDPFIDDAPYKFQAQKAIADLNST